MGLLDFRNGLGYASETGNKNESELDPTNMPFGLYCGRCTIKKTLRKEVPENSIVCIH